MGFQSDYILRLIEMVSLLVERIMGRIGEGEPAEALELADEAIGELAGLPVDTFDAMSGAGLIAFLSAGGVFDVEVARPLSELLSVRALAHESMGDTVRAERDRERAQVLSDASV